MKIRSLLNISKKILIVERKKKKKIRKSIIRKTSKKTNRVGRPVSKISTVRQKRRRIPAALCITFRAFLADGIRVLRWYALRRRVLAVCRPTRLSSKRTERLGRFCWTRSSICRPKWTPRRWSRRPNESF